MKRCSKCKELKELSEFYSDKRKPDGKVAECKECWKLREKAKYHTDEITRERKSEGAKTQRDKVKHSEYNKKYAKTARGKEVQKTGKTNYRSKFPERIRAKNLVHYYVRKGKIPHVSTCICSCGNQATDYHHPDYSKPLEIVPLCRSCHLQVHREMIQSS
jgi:Bacillus phage endonuclease